MPTAKATGIAIPVTCSNHHVWALRVSSWLTEFPQAAKKLREREPQWTLEELGHAIRHLESELKTKKKKYFELYGELTGKKPRRADQFFEEEACR